MKDQRLHDAVDELFGDDTLDTADEPTWCSALRELCAPVEVQGCWLLDPQGAVLSHSSKATPCPRSIASLLLAGASESRKVVVHEEGALRWGAFGVIDAGEASGFLLLGLQNPVHAAAQSNAWSRSVAAGARLALHATTATRQRDEQTQRVKHLLAEQRTLLRDHKRIVETNLNERESAVKEKQALIADLERQVELRTHELAAAKVRAEKASVDKSRFLANMSHEIRTPMTAILGYTDLLLSSPSDPQELARSLQTIRRNGDHLLTLINDILDLSKIESGRLPIEHLPTSIGMTLRDVVELLRVRADAKGINLNLTQVGRIPETILTDPTRFRQIVTNVVGNAIKFTSHGGVDIKVSLDAEAGPGPQLVVRIKDSGIGMAPDQLESIFEPFVQADVSTTRKYGGTGLGLTISRHLARQLGGDLTVSSTSDEGSTFELRVGTGPLSDVALIESLADGSPTGRERSEPAQESYRFEIPILLAEDGPDNQRLITAILTRAGAQVTAVADGRSAVDEAMKALAQGRPFPLILMDMQMPEMDGWAAASELRRRGYTGRIIALTANAMVGDRERCLTAGCDDYATKPIERKTLFATMYRQLGASRGK